MPLFMGTSESLEGGPGGGGGITAQGVAPGSWVSRP